jgi:excisionase family DNA binding protein
MSNSSPKNHWLHMSAACEYLGLRRGTLEKKIAEGTGPRFFYSPGSRDRIFHTSDLDQWVMDSPRRELTRAEIARLEKFHAGAERALEKRRARCAPKITEDMTM